MDRSLDQNLLKLALGEHAALPSAEELSGLLASAELALLLHRPEISSDLASIGWYLHGIASSKNAFQIYGLERQQAAYSVSAHIFDLLLQTRELSRFDRLKYCFATQIAFLRSSLDPNSLAVYKREFAGKLNNISLLTDFQEVSLSCAIALLGFDVNYIFSVGTSLRTEILRLVDEWQVDSIDSTPFGSAAGVALGARSIMIFLTYGRIEALERAREELQRSIDAPFSSEDTLSRWIAAHLLNLANDIDKVSIWTVLPPDIPSNIKKAFVMGHPRVLTLWPPQIDLLAKQDAAAFNPFSGDVKRLFLSTPTSGGKTLLAQLLVTAQLSQNNTSICYVAPTRSLCNEIRKSLDSRMRFLGKEVIGGLPEGDWLEDFSEIQPEVEVMTPERLSYLIRSDGAQVLTRFGLFIFDEVHLVGEASRGWSLEESLTYLNHATKDTNHRIVLVSAVVGNRSHFIAWMSGEKQVVHHNHSIWRGPRRLHAIWTTEPDWNSKSTKKMIRSKKFDVRETYPLYGLLNAKMSRTGEIHVLKTDTAIGQLVFKKPLKGGRVRDTTETTPFYKSLIPIIRHLGQSGPILIIESTRPQTVLMARAIADDLDEIDIPELKHLVDLVRLRLGSEHPLLQVLRKGVAYHHGSLPDEIRSSIEESVTKGHLTYLVATTTLTEGVNLPVKSVVIASQGSFGNEGYVEYIKGSKLINAIGRAGRATKETEGVVVLARPGPLNPADFDKLTPSDSELQITSMLASAEALNALSDFEEAWHSSNDEVFFEASREVSDFLSFIWFMAAELEKVSKTITSEQIQEILEHSLGWVQLGPNDKKRWLDAGQLALSHYQSTQVISRRRWASAGTSINSAREIENISKEIAAVLLLAPIPDNPISVVNLIMGDGRLKRMLTLPEAPRLVIYSQRGGQTRKEIAISLENLMKDWLIGSDLTDLADGYLRGVADIDYRFEQLGDFLHNAFEIYFPWIFGTIISWTNSVLQEMNVDTRLPKTIAANIRWGVDSSTALQLMIRGMASRRLAAKIAKKWIEVESDTDIFGWLRSMSVADWQKTFDASPAELRSILELSRNKQGGVSVDLILKGVAELEFQATISELQKTTAFLAPPGESEIDPITISIAEQVIGVIPSRDQTDILSLFETGLIFSLNVSVRSRRGLLEIELIDPDL